MSSKRKIPLQLPLLHSPYNDSSSSEDEDQYVVQSVNTHAKTSKPTDHDSETDSETDSDPDLPTKIVVFAPPQIPSEYEDPSEEEIRENVAMPARVPETEPDKKKLKLSEPNQSLSKKSASAMARIWSQDDEMVLLRALSEYQSRNGTLPSPKDYTFFLSTISGYIGFPVTEKQLANKVRLLKHSFEQKKKKGPNVKITKPHAKAVFEICAKLFQDGTKASKKGVSFSPDSNSDNTEISNEAMGNMAPANSGSDNGAAGTRSYIHLESLITDIISRQQCESWVTVKDVIVRIGESEAQSLEAKTKMLRIDTFELRAREERLKADVFGFLAEGMKDG